MRERGRASRPHPQRSSLRLRGASNFLGFVLDLLAGLADIDAALEEGAIFDRDALGDYVAGQRTFVADVDAVGGGQVATDLAEDNDLARVDVGGDTAVAANGNAVASQVDRAFDAAIDIERFATGDFTLDHERLADRGLVLSIQGGVAAGRHRSGLAHRAGGRSRGGRGRGRALRFVTGRSRIRSVCGLPHDSVNPSFAGEIPTDTSRT